ncbi:helicase protein MOM1-like isoform X2 [Solanum dulcamara]|uniref:helicase protein MOM1-like isoform X2 n=1 Tax=Solanum dulcamara TaxID=45834 RepID=UPI002486BB68|nr:helicase protein MOM1-like isoform X2 [Solanum dulcamara]
MASETRSGRKNKDTESNKSKNKQSDKGSLSSGSGKTDRSSLRRSGRETKQAASNPSSIRKSKRLEKQSPTPLTVKRRAALIKKPNSSSPLRRSDRGKKHTLSSSSRSSYLGRGSDSSSVKKEKKEKSVKELIMESESYSTSRENGAASVGLKRKRMDARSYKALFKMQRKRYTAPENNDKLESPKKPSRVDSIASDETDCKLINGDNESHQGVVKELKEHPDGVASARSISSLEASAADASVNDVGELPFSKLKEHPDGVASARSISSLEASAADASVNDVGEWPFSKLKEHPDGVASARSISSLEASVADASVNDVGELPYSNHRCCSTEKSAALPAENGSEVSKDGCTVGEICDDSERLPEGCSVPEDKLHIAELMCSTSTDGDIIVKGGELGTGNCSVTHNDTCDLAEVFPPPLGDLEKLGYGGTCASCSRRIRLNHDSPEEELCSCAGMSGRDCSNLSSLKDRVGSEAAILFDSGERCNIQLNEALSVSQRGSDEKMCAICKQAGKILICDGRGCKRCYHLSCLDPPLDDFPPGAWHCTLCVKKKIESGVHSVTEGVESILDVREVEVADAKGMHRQKQYLVKYHGLAHAHNHWVAEAQLLIDAPLLIANYNHKNQDVRWISEWTVPHRLLKKRSLMFSKMHGQDAGDNNKCLFEWLVKWKGLGYEYATWELGNANFLNSQHGENLIKDFNIRREKAKRRIDKNHKGPLVKLSELPAGGSLITDSNLLNNVNKLRECWLKCQNTAVFDDKDRIMKMVLFILSLSDICCPFLIVTTSNSLSQWEAEFTRLAPSIDVVVYSGSRNSRRRIKSLEFYDEGGFMMLQVLLSSLEAVIEDVEILSGLSWEVAIIDDCQNVGISARVEQIKILATGVRVLLFNGPMKITSYEYLNLLSLLECKFGLDKTGGVESDFNDHLGKLKRVTKVTAPCSKPESSKFVEYWVPVQISDMQLEQYCATLLTNSNALRTFTKSDPVGTLRDILLSVRKCCDHPYILDPLLQPFNKGLSPAEMLEVGIKASGKLQFLDKMLAEMRLRQHRVVILFQSIVGSGSGASIGDILDDFLRQRFGEDSYERVETGVVMSKRQASLHRFNNKESGRFVLLLENRVCHPSIKLLSVDSVIIYDSETNPANDLRQLQKLSIDSESKYISVFRLYSCFTVEERALVLAKQDLNHDSNLHSSISRSPNNTLMWGASNLFSRLDEYHSGGIPTSISNNSSGKSLLNAVISEFSAIISKSSDDKDICHSIISKVQMSMGTYNANILLLGEEKMELKIGVEPQVFWRGLLEGRNPEWRNLSRATPRNRKRVQYFDESPDPPNGNDEAGKKRRKVVNRSVDAIPNHSLPGRGAHENDDIGGEHVSRSPSNLLHEAKLVRPEEGRILYNEQKSLHIHLKAEFAKLFEVLKLSDAVKHTVGKFLEYVMENHRVSREPATILQAFQLSLCWVAASILKQKIDKEETFLLAKQHLKFGCTEEETNNVCLKIRSLKKLFLQWLDQNDNASSSSNCSFLVARSIAEEPSTGSMSQVVESPQANVQKQMEERLQDKKLYRQCIVKPKEELVDIERETFIKEVQCRCERRMSNLVQKQKEEIEEFQKVWDKKKEELEQEYRLQFAVVRSIYGQNAAIKDRQKPIETEFSRKMQELKCYKDQKLKELEVEHSAMKNKEMQKASLWLAEANSFRAVGSHPIDGIGCSQENVNVSHNSPKTVQPVTGHHVKELNAGNILDNMRSDVPASTSVESDILPIESTNVLTTPATEDLAGVKSVERGLVALSKRSNEVGGPDVPASTYDESNILTIETTNVLTMPAMEEQVEIMSTAEVLVAKSNQLEPNEGDDLGCSSEGIGALGARSKQPNEVGDPDLPASTSDESNILPVESSNVLTMPAMEKQLEIASMAGAFVAKSNQPNEIGDLGGSSEEIGALSASSKQATEVSDPDVPASTSNVSNILPIETSNVLTTPATEEQVKITSSTGALVARSKQPNEVDDSGGSSAEIVSVFPLPPEEHTEVILEDPTREHLSEVSGSGFDVVLGNDNSEVNVTEEFNTEHDSPQNNSHLRNDEDNPRDAVRSTDTNLISPLKLVVDLPLVAAALCSDDGGSLPQNQSSGYNGTLTHEMPLPENQSGTQVEVDAGQYGANSSEAVLISSSEQQQPASDGFSLAAHDPLSDITHDIHNDERNFMPNLGSTRHLDGETMEPLQAGGNSEECPSVDVEMSPLSCEITNFSEVSRVDPRPISEQGASSHNIGTPVQVPGSAELPSPAVLQYKTNAAVVQGPRNIPVHPDHQMATWNSTLPFNADPLHKDWERIHKEREQGTKILEDMKLRLRSDCEKEIEEMIAQIRKKYDHKLQEAEAAFLRKKKELDVNQNKVLMNKLLADAFRCKCMNLKPSGFPGMRQVVPSSYLQHLHQVSQQPNLRSSPMTGSSSASQQSSVPVCLRASPVTSLSSASQAQVRQDTSVPSNRSVYSGGICQPTVRCAPVNGLSLAGQPAPTQQIAAGTRSTAHSAGTPGRPPLISAITPSTGNLRVASEIRAPAPHLQPFRTPSSMSSGSSPSTLAHSIQNHPQSTYMAASSPSLPQLTSLLTTSSPSPSPSPSPSQSQHPQHQISTPLVPQVAVDLSSPRNPTLQHDIGGLPAARNQSISAQELLFNVENQPHANRPNIMPPLPDVDSDFDLLDLSEFQTLDSVQGVSTSSAGATNVTDVVCVSDDD